MRNQSLLKNSLRLTIVKCLIIASVTLTTGLSTTAKADVCDFIYGVYDKGLNSSQFVKIDPDTFTIQELGYDDSGYHSGLDIKGLALSHKNKMYTYSSDEAAEVGLLYEVEIETGQIIGQGHICFEISGEVEVAEEVKDLLPTTICGTEISAISFHPSGSLSAWSEECGLVDVNLDDPTDSKLVVPFATDKFKACLSTNKKDWQRYTSHIEDITWDNTGEILYVANGSNIEAYQFSNEDTISLSKIYLIGGTHVETIEMLPDNNTLIFKHNSRTLKTLNLVKNVVETVNNDVSPYNDIKAVAACVKPIKSNETTDKPIGNPNASCPADTIIMAKFEWKDNTYVFEKSEGSKNVVTISDGATATGGTWSSTANITHFIVKGGTTTEVYNTKSPTGGEFNSNALVNIDGQIADISNIQFCGSSVDETESEPKTIPKPETVSKSEPQVCIMDNLSKNWTYTTDYIADAQILLNLKFLVWQNKKTVSLP
ncbi:hypothetical protein [Candidatus Parabeggiatoa sp. HSG14]|uniref:hypothetical protein n=1 Tax=Candidatus Parabeggiatoa sp. HSG14 TaxID=3055593 RepID=UPI0025A8073D|nr:hypothetical protein [Thiotrichales bacterium HSG14]